MPASINKAIDQFIIRCRSADDIIALKSSLSDFLDLCPIDTMSYHCLPPIGAKVFAFKDPLMTYGVPEKFIDIFKKNDFRAIEALLRSDFTFETPVKMSDSRNDSVFNSQQRDFFDVLGEYGFKNICVMRTYGPRDYRGAVFLGFDEREEWQQFVILSKIQSVFQAWHVRFVKMHRAQLPQISFSNRESEIIHWVCMGKSNAAIAEIVGLSTHTVSGYLRNIFIKLGVNDRVSASLTAQALGLTNTKISY